MLVKIHKRGSGAGRGPIDYLLGRDREREHARVLSGDPEQMIELIDSNKFAQKYTSLVLSFAENDLPEQDKRQIMDDFEGTLFPGLDKDQYSILWVEHLDKGRLELNAVVANVELISGKRLQPYYDRADRPLVNAFQQITNNRYGLTDPDDPLRARALVTPANLPEATKRAQEAITSGLMGMVASGQINDRNDVIKTLQHGGFEIARTTPTTISIKNPEGGRNVRLKGAIYAESFRGGDQLSGAIEARAEAYAADVEQRIGAAQSTFDSCLNKKRGYHIGRFRKNAAKFQAGGDAKPLDNTAIVPNLRRSVSDNSVLFHGAVSAKHQPTENEVAGHDGAGERVIRQRRAVERAGQAVSRASGASAITDSRISEFKAFIKAAAERIKTHAGNVFNRGLQQKPDKDSVSRGRETRAGRDRPSRNAGNRATNSKNMPAPRDGV
jgi:hypothetical protein